MVPGKRNNISFDQDLQYTKAVDIHNQEIAKAKRG